MDKTLSSRVKKLCSERGITLKQLAEKMGIKPESLSRALNGNPQLSTLENITKTLEVDVSDLFNSRTPNIPSSSNFMAMIVRDGKGYYFHNEQELWNWLDDVRGCKH